MGSYIEACLVSENDELDGVINDTKKLNPIFLMKQCR